MSDTHPEVPASPPAPMPSMYSSIDSLWSPQVVIGFFALIMVSGTIIGVFLKADPPTLQLVIGLVIGGYGKDVISFFYGSSRGSQAKDERAAAAPVKPTGE